MVNLGQSRCTKNVELILLKGHLILEILIANTLAANDFERESDYSFYKKIDFLKSMPHQKSALIERVSAYLFQLNKMRNKLAHEFSYDINNGELEKWSSDVLDSFEGIKFTKFTYRTKIVHAFSALAKVLVEIE